MTGVGARPDPVSRLVKALAEDQDFTSVEIAETLWLALQIEPATPPAPDAEPEEPSPPPPEIPPDDLDDEPPEFEPEEQDTPPPPPTPRANIAAPTPQVGVLPPQTLPVWLADPAMLTDSLAIIRALKPLLKKVDAGVGKHLDESATVETIARTRLVLPVMKAEKEPWFDIVLVVDRGSSMAIWQRLVKDVVRILRRYGAFRDVRVFDLVVNPEAPVEEKVRLIANPQRPGHRPSELIDQQGRRIALVLSDCAGAYWWDGTLLPMLQDWGKIMPTMIWHMLPPWMWKRTALGRGTAVAISNDMPGVENQRLKVQVQERRAPGDAHQRVAMPVVTSDLKDLARWSLMLAGDRRELTPGFLLLQQGAVVPRSKTYDAIAEERARQNVVDEATDEELQAAYDQALKDLARERVVRFLELASPEAQRLIMLLAAAPVITLPVVRLIRDAMLCEARSPLPVAEVFLSGLLQRLPGQDIHQLERQLAQEQERSQADSAALGETAGLELSSVVLEAQELVQYDFAPRVRSVLLDYLPAVETIEVINSVSAAVERRWNQVSDQDFRAFLTDPNVEVPEELSGLRSFASVTADILEQLGSEEYAQFAQDLRRGAGELPSEDIGETGDNDWPDFPLKTFEYEVAEYLNFPPLEPFEFIEAQLVDEPEEAGFPPPLQTEVFTIVTFDVVTEPDSSTTEAITENDLRRAISQDEFVLLYQPIFNLANLTIVGFEALLRWQHPQQGLISPKSFIPLAEELGLGAVLGNFALERACHQLASWHHQFPGHQHIEINVNVSPSLFQEPNFVERTRQILDRISLNPSSLVLEIYESFLFQSDTITLLQQLSDLGIKLSLDDFGTGYSSLSYLNRAPFDQIKIDRSFVRNLLVEDTDNSIIETIIVLGHRMNMTVVAEGIETSDQLVHLQELQCERGQGYLLSRPCTIEFAEQLLTQEQTSGISAEPIASVSGAKVIPQVELVTFSFDMATVERNANRWRVRKQRRQAQRYIERLGNSIFITMVAIPGGSFVMGSPDYELERDKDEGPRHDVQVRDFFMGRYPITQEQWHIVAAMPQISRPLNPSPSRFKGNNRPVEQVSWQDAIEFCGRLSVYTGRAYRLPTEAEWEYACRARTTTPFHFGETISLL
jgi:EAL domain-containing protein (putative c-di-GMP-specific phosphodiesterase class I)